MKYRIIFLMLSNSLLQYTKERSHHLSQTTEFSEYYEFLQKSTQESQEGNECKRKEKNEHKNKENDTFHITILKLINKSRGYFSTSNIEFTGGEIGWLTNFLYSLTLANKMISPFHNNIDHNLLLHMENTLIYPSKYKYLKKIDMADCIAACLIKDGIYKTESMTDLVTTIDEESCQRIKNMLQEYQIISAKYHNKLPIHSPSLSMKDVLTSGDMMHCLNLRG